jgi:hypothetical protein
LDKTFKTNYDDAITSAFICWYDHIFWHYYWCPFFLYDSSATRDRNAFLLDSM